MAPPEQGQVTLQLNIGGSADVGLVADAVEDVRRVCDLATNLQRTINENAYILPLFQELDDEDWDYPPLSSRQRRLIRLYGWPWMLGDVTPRFSDAQANPTISLIDLTYSNPFGITLGIEKAIDSVTALLEVIRDWGSSRAAAWAAAREAGARADMAEEQVKAYRSARWRLDEAQQYIVDELVSRDLALTPAQIAQLLSAENMRSIDALGSADLSIEFPPT